MHHETLVTRSESLWIRSAQSQQPSGCIPHSGAPRPYLFSASTVAFAAKSRSRTSTGPCWAARWRGLWPRDLRGGGDRHLSSQKKVENCRVFVPSFVGESWVKIPVKTTVKTLCFGTNKNEQRASTANAVAPGPGARCRMSSELACGATFAFNTDRDTLHCFS